MIGLGDSYGSGEGVPDVPVSQPALDAVAAAQGALAAAEQAFAQSLAAYTLAQQDLNDLVPLLNTAISRYNAWVASAQEVVDACNNLPPTPLLCADANLAYAQAGAQLTAALVPLGLESLFGESTLLGVLTSWRTSLQNAYANALAVMNADARDAAKQSLDQAWAEIGPRWQGRQCHRSASSGQVLAAKQLEDADPHTSVTFVHLACSGAKVWKGLLESYGGQERIDSEGSLAPQVDEAAELVAGREVDGLVVSIGGNDVNFANVLLNCVTKEPCFDEPAPEDPTVQAVLADYCAPLGVLAPYCLDYFDSLYAKNPGSASRIFFDGGDPVDQPDDHERGLDDLPATYDALETRLEDLAKDGQLEGLFESRGNVRLYLTAYPSITRREPATPAGPTEPCGFDPLAPLAGRLQNLPGLSLGEVLWAEGVVAPALAGTMEASAQAHRWRFVDQHVPSFDGHGYCADDNWLVRIPQSIRAQIRPSLGAIADVVLNSASGSAHPNASGHRAYASAIFGALVCDLYPGCDPTASPRAPRLASRPVPGTKLVVGDTAGKPRRRKIALVSKSALIETPAPGPEDPTQLGGVLRVANPRSGGDDALFVLPAAGWKGLGKPAGSKGWQYTDRRAASGPCTSVVVKAGRSVTAACAGAAIPLTLDEPAQGSLAASLTLGNDATHCMEFGGNVQKDRPAVGNKRGVFQAKDAPAPPACVLP